MWFLSFGISFLFLRRPNPPLGFLNNSSDVRGGGNPIFKSFCCVCELLVSFVKQEEDDVARLSADDDDTASVVCVIKDDKDDDDVLILSSIGDMDNELVVDDR